jgi:hypothetical protein
MGKREVETLKLSNSSQKSSPAEQPQPDGGDSRNAGSEGGRRKSAIGSQGDAVPLIWTTQSMYCSFGDFQNMTQIIPAFQPAHSRLSMQISTFMIVLH